MRNEVTSKVYKRLFDNFAYSIGSDVIRDMSYVFPTEIRPGDYSELYAFGVVSGDLKTIPLPGNYQDGDEIRIYMIAKNEGVFVITKGSQDTEVLVSNKNGHTSFLMTGVKVFDLLYAGVGLSQSGPSDIYVLAHIYRPDPYGEV
jgi:hypothetical protein